MMNKIQNSKFKIQNQRSNIKNENLQYSRKDVVVLDRLMNNQTFNISEGENKIIFILLTDGENQDGNLRINIEGADAKVLILGIVLGYGKQKIKFLSVQNHIGFHSSSNLLVKAVLFDEAEFEYQGLIRIEKEAKKSDAYLKSRNLLLSDKARVIICPHLEILADDVNCSHGVVISDIDKKELYYLASRGIETQEAKKLIITGFINEILDYLEDTGLANELRNKIDLKVNEVLNRHN